MIDQLIHRDTFLEQQQTEKVETEVRDIDRIRIIKVYACCPVVGVFDEPYSQLTPLSGVAVQGHQSTSLRYWNRVQLSIVCTVVM